MIFRDILIENFLSISSAHVEFTPGVHLIEGINHDMESDDQESNGSGKSSILEALYWVLYDVISRNKVPVDSVVNNSVGKDCLVRVRYSCNGHEYEITRTRKHSKHGNMLKILVDGKDLTQHRNKDSEKELESLLPVSKDVFRYAVYSGQGFLGNFLNASESEKQDIISSIIQLSVYDLASLQVKASLSGLNTKSCLLTAEIAQINKQKMSLLSMKEEMEGKLSQLISSHGDIPVKIGNKIKLIDDELESLKIEELEIPEKDSAVANRILAREAQLPKITEYVQKAMSAYDVGSTAARNTKKELEDLTSVQTECPTCKRPFGNTKPIDKINELKEKLKAITEKLKSVSEKKTKASNTLSEVNTDLSRLRSEQRRLSGARLEIEKRRSVLHEDRSKAERIASEFERQEVLLRGKIEHNEKLLKEQEVSLLDAGVRHTDLLKEIAHWEYWQTSVPLLRSSSINEVLDYLNSRIEVYLSSFSSGGIGMSLIQEQHGKGTRIKTDIRTPGGSYAISSGGEKRRVDLAIFLALSDLLQVSSGVRCNLLVADEIADGLSWNGVKKFLEVLKDKASQDGSCVFVISHNNAVKQVFDFDSVKLVVKKNGISTLHSVS